MPDDSHTPTEAQIAAILAKYTPRQIAIAYLRAQHRARQAETVGKLWEGMSDLQHGLATGNREQMRAGARKFRATAQTHKQANEETP